MNIPSRCNIGKTLNCTSDWTVPFEYEFWHTTGHGGERLLPSSDRCARFGNAAVHPPPHHGNVLVTPRIPPGSQSSSGSSGSTSASNSSRCRLMSRRGWSALPQRRGTPATSSMGPGLGGSASPLRRTVKEWPLRLSGHRDGRLLVFDGVTSGGVVEEPARPGGMRVPLRTADQAYEKRQDILNPHPCGRCSLLVLGIGP